MTTPASAPDATVSLLCLGDRPAPPTLAADMDALVSLTPLAKEQLRDILLPCLAPSLEPTIDADVERFARRTEVATSKLVAALRGCRFLFDALARAGAEPHVLAADLARLSPSHAEALSAVLLPLFEPAIRKLRGELIRRTILDHGALLTGTDWRVDRILGSQHGAGLDATLGVLTFTYKRGQLEERLTLHCEPGALRSLRAAVDAMLA
ncbi:MAG: hypothetical protein FJ095_16900 [Deltaproteobacteria bacterium]|nr:hypothetical protein [Deltaproteobacteria bacterium]